MMNIIICDDEPIIAEKIEKFTSEQLQQRGICGNISRCSTSEDFRSLASKFKPDLIFMDIVMDREDGYVLIDEYRRTGAVTEIAFITGYSERMAESFAHRPIGYLVKPVTAQQIGEVIDRFMFFHSENKVYRMEIREKYLNIPVNSIKYFESAGHTVTIHCVDNDYRMTCKLDEVEKEVTGSGFIRVHKSFLANARFVTGISTAKTRVILRTGEELPISRRFYREAFQRIVESGIR